VSPTDDVKAVAMKYTAHGTVTGDATEQTPPGCGLELRSSCGGGEVFAGHVTPRDGGLGLRGTGCDRPMPVIFGRSPGSISALQLTEKQNATERAVASMSSDGATMAVRIV
jgi:hypothetical protein